MHKLKYYFKSIRWFEIGVRMGAPVIAMLISLPLLNLTTVWKALHALVAFFFCWAHGYTLNEWGGYSSDKYDPSKADTPLISGKVSQREILMLSIIFACVSIILYFFLNPILLTIIFLDIFIGVIYAYPKILLKTVPMFSLAILFVVSVNDFLLGWLVFSPNLYRGVLIGVYFGILGISGILYHEVGDHDSDRAMGINTNAVRYGKKTVFISGFFFYIVSVLYFLLLTCLKIVPEKLYIVFLVTLPVYVYIFYLCLKSNLSASNVHRFIKKYRILYGFVGLCLISILMASYL